MSNMQVHVRLILNQLTSVVQVVESWQWQMQSGEERGLVMRGEKRSMVMRKMDLGVEVVVMVEPLEGRRQLFLGLRWRGWVP